MHADAGADLPNLTQPPVYTRIATLHVHLMPVRMLQARVLPSAGDLG